MAIQFVIEHLVQMLDDLRVAFHGKLLRDGRCRWLPVETGASVMATMPGNAAYRLENPSERTGQKYLNTLACDLD